MKAKIPVEPIKNTAQRWITLGISTGLGLGYAPKAPGTFGSLLGIPLGLFLLQYPTWLALLIAALIFIAFATLADRAARHWGESDCQKIVSDEVLGQALVFLTINKSPLLTQVEICTGLYWKIPPLSFIVIGFIFFRLLDIVKPYPARTFDRQGGGFGIVADDVVAGLYGAIMLLGLSRIWHSSSL